jgi:hypothetical protein
MEKMGNKHAQKQYKASGRSGSKKKAKKKTKLSKTLDAVDAELRRKRAARKK